MIATSADDPSGIEAEEVLALISAWRGLDVRDADAGHDWSMACGKAQRVERSPLSAASRARRGDRLRADLPGVRQISRGFWPSNTFVAGALSAPTA